MPKELTLDVMQAITAVVDYLMPDEQADYYEQDEAGQQNHIYLHLSVLNNFLSD